MSKLFTPLRAGALSLGHRVVMAPLTRMRSDSGDRPNALMREYYGQRTSEGGLIISEATPISRQGYGYAGAPGIYDDAQIEGWRAITDEVHARGGQIIMQLWHVGRQSHPDIQPNGEEPVAPSAIQADGYGYSVHGAVPFSMPRALERHEIREIVAQFGAGAARAREAGFDGVEVHGANGYLPDQFLQDGTNKRTDEYGGAIENRARFLLEVTHAAIDAVGADRVGVRLSPSGTYGSMSDGDPEATFGYAAAKLDEMGIAYLHVVEPRIRGTELIAEAEPVAAKHLRPIFGGTLIAAGGFDGPSAEAILEAGDADAVAFGRAFISNPDLAARLRVGLPLTPYDRTTFYGGDARGYTDYPFHSHAA
ncbi:N-ethylmaleimide reductase [Hartmannibacter diazotrophicus]|uniref:N-ethylmaleimide reductase n=1 Tax=Hartmannibacter diazotrophicus TaxID=1482074 RepID=A0A2C9D4G6_9HYPH|nr:alkene reductase [Hartmannibacter diazotrophicus]SON55176.1 N-ethylmaleimide reductase [Hartmannibacter diazotrophicus]